MSLNSLFAFITVSFLWTNNVFSQQFVQTKQLDSISMFFKFGSAEVENPQRLIFRCNHIKATSGKIRIVSYTDTIGSQKSNKKLASKRLNSIAELVKSTSLQSFVIDSINKNETRGGKKLADTSFRRVDIIFYSVEDKFRFNTPINLDINFESGTDIIIPSSTENLKTLLSMLQTDSTIRVQLNGHVCCRAGHELSVQRAERVKKYLISSGIKSARIQCKGFSNTVPLVPYTDIENIHKNMRVEVVFVK
jgi:outer membrane protein OmpA-like peptidoglycan-associated protein